MTRMQLTRLRIEQLRQFRQPYELKDFEPGLNLFTGPNEAGKSTLVRAIRAAFFERHRSTSVEDLKPWGDSSAAPSIELDFNFDGKPYRLSKSFLGHKRCDLMVGTSQFDGAAAEDHLANLFGFAFPGRGASRAEHWGIPGLLWVEQGSGQELDVSHASDHLHQAVNGQASGDASHELAATGGDDILKRLQDLRGELLTPTGRPKAAYSKAAEDVVALEQQVKELEGQIQTYQQQVDNLTRLREQHQTDERDKPWEALQSQLDDCQAKQLELQKLESRLSTDRVKLAQLEQTKNLLQAQVVAFGEQENQAQAREQAALKAQAQLDLTETALELARQKEEDARQRTGRARDTLSLAQQEATRKLLNEQLQDATASALQQSQAMERALAEEEKMSALRRSAAEVMIRQEAVTELEKLDHAAREAEIKRQAVATRLRFELDPGKTLEVVSTSGSQQLSGQSELLIDAAMSLVLPGLGSLTITPGGEDLAGLIRQHEDALQAFRHQLLLLGVSDLAQAQQRLLTHKALAGEILLAEQALLIVAPQGIGELRAQQDQSSARIRQIQDALDRLPAASGELVISLDDAQRKLDSADALESVAREALNAADRERVTALSQRDQAVEERDVARSLMADPQRLTKLAQVQDSLLANQAEHSALAARIDRDQGDWKQANPHFIAQDIQRLQQSLQNLQQVQVKRREAMLVLQNTLELAGAQGLDEQLQQLQSKLILERKRLAELQRRAEVLSLLCDKLESKRQATLQRLQAPLLQRMRHYLQLLFPGSRMELDDQLAPQKLLRNRAGLDQVDTVQDLSFGSREQLGLISRFAYADLLAQSGRPTLLILDDALVHSDEDRLSQMKRVIFDVAQRHQVLLFTCHTNAWRDVGAYMRTI